MTDQTLPVRSQSKQEPLADFERDLIKAAEEQPWSERLRAMLAYVVERRDGHVKQYDSCGDLVESLELLVGEGRA